MVDFPVDLLPTSWAQMDIFNSIILVYHQITKTVTSKHFKMYEKTQNNTKKTPIIKGPFLEQPFGDSRKERPPSNRMKSQQTLSVGK